MVNQSQSNISTSVRDLSSLEDRAKLFGRYSKLPEAKWIVEGIAMEGGVTVLAGLYGVGKTTFMLQLIDTLNQGNTLFNLNTMPVKALLIEQDESHYVMGNHIKRVLPSLPTLKDMEYPHAAVRWDSERNTFSDNILQTLIEAYPARLVIIDSLTSIGLPDINHPSMGSLFDEIRLVVNITKCGIIILHHLNRRGAILGSVQIWNKPDNVLELQSDGLVFYKVRGETPHITQTKVAKGASGNSVRLPFYPLERNKTTLCFDTESKTFIIGLIQQGKSKQEAISIVEQEYGLSHDAARKRVDRALALKSERK